MSPVTVTCLSKVSSKCALNDYVNEWVSEWFSEWMTFRCHLLFDRPFLWSLSLSKPVLVKGLEYLNCVSQELVQICSAFNCYVVQISPHLAWVFFRNHPFISIFVTGHYYEASCWSLRRYIDYCMGFTFEGSFLIHADGKVCIPESLKLCLWSWLFWKHSLNYCWKIWKDRDN